MPSYPERTLNVEMTTTLTIVQRDANQVETLVDADGDVSIGVTVFGVSSASSFGQIQHQSTGVYTCTWTPIQLGLHVITWSFTLGADAFDDGDGEGRYTSVEKIMVVADVEGTSDSVGVDDPVTAGPAIGSDKICTVTAQFYDSSGNAMLGVYVRFTPTRDTTMFLTSGVVAAEVDAQSDATGAFSLALVRGTTGTLAITGLGIVRQVTIPDVATIPLKDLVEMGDDPLEVQRPQFKKLPRRS